MPVPPTGAGSPVVLARVGELKIAYVADADDRRVLAIDAESLSELSAIDVEGAPDQVLVTHQGRLFATLRDTNTVVAIEGTGVNGDTMRVVGRAQTPPEPIGLAVTGDGAKVLVASGWGHALTEYDAATLHPRFSRDLGREPRAVVVSDDGKRAFVTHAVGGDVDFVDLEGEGPPKLISIVAGPAGQGFSVVRGVAPAGRIFVPHAIARTTLAPMADVDARPSGYGSVEQGPTETFDVAVLDEDTGVRVPGSIDGGLACVLPRAAAVTAAGELLVACMGTNEVVGMDAASAAPPQATTQRWNVPAGPTGIAVDDANLRALVWSQFDRALSWILTGPQGFVLAWSRLPSRAPLPAIVERGRRLFHLADARISQDGRACASCHPDGRDDGLVWSTPDGPRNPPMLAGRLDRAAPYGWLGSAPDVTSHLTQTLNRLGGKNLARDDREALTSYVKWMKAPTAAKVDAASPLLLEGRRIYESAEAGCSGCHGDPSDGPDGTRHNVLSWAQGDLIGVFDTPSLRFVGGTAPYFHDGRYKSIRDLLAHTGSTMGQKKKLSPSQIEALEAYVSTL